ncbi:hypothetical protein JKP75_02480 [Blastococcus sp. TML/M2B]|uniref:hypothetical protein n=1 Tax=unclassified Blastococcus TaxID=2619396 RepID=UPI00190B660D|nr:MULTISPECIES: hypothetical protein [unclassified Blastococcus]MBN1091543.1 hypothetical protein [Blastococcus sp. TML/M2B]MBN1094906.1 hypothetical protein [Blastococcus sp. TML/C7B]
MGRLIAVVLFIALLVPGVLLSRAWARAADRRAVAGGSVELVEPTAEGAAALTQQAQHGRRWRRLGLLLGIAGIVGVLVLVGESSVFLWVPILVLGLLAGVLLAEVTRPRPRWAVAQPHRRPRRAELISAWLVWTMRLEVVAVIATAAWLWSGEEVGAAFAGTAVAVPGVAWVLAELALLRAVVRPLPAAGADVPVDEALRTWTAHLVSAATGVLALLPLGALLLTAGIDRGDRVTEHFDLLPVGLVAGGFCTLSSGLAVAFFLVTWLRPVRAGARALAG